MIKKLTVITMIVSGFLFTGCATMDAPTLREKIPSGTYLSKKPPKEVAICISEYWDKGIKVSVLGHKDIDVKLRLNGYSAQIILGDNMWATADVDKTKNGSRTVLYMLAASYDELKNAVMSCQQ